MKINKMKNCYGIKEINNIEFKNSSVIYAPNGTFKTSFYKSLKNFHNGKENNVLDRLTKGSAEIDLYIGSESIKTGNAKIIFFNSEELIKSIEDPFFYESILLGNELPKESQELMKIIDEFSKLINELTVDDMKLLLIEEEDCSIDKIIKIIRYIRNNNLTEINEFFQKIDKKNKLTYEVLEKSGIFTEKVKSKMDTLSNKLNFNLRLINEKFSYNDAKNLFAISEKFYESGHSLNILDRGNEVKINTFQEFKELYDREKNEILKEFIDEKEFQDIEKTLDNNANNRIIKNAILDSPQNSLAIFSKNKIEFKLLDYLIELEKINIEDITKSVKTLRQKPINNRIKFEKLISSFNAKFNLPIKLIVNESIDSKIGLKLPSIIMQIRGEEYSGEIKDFLSTGELNALALLQLYIKVQAGTGKELILIDDNQEVFDYAFKYGFIEYLIELIEEKNKLIILSHNYDFLRSLSSKVKPTDLDYYSAFSNDNQIVKISPIKTLDLMNLKNTFSYSSKNKERIIIAAIPKFRNVEEFLNGTESTCFKSLTMYLHYSDDLENKDINDILLNLNHSNLDEQFKENIDTKIKYLILLENTCNKICSDFKGNAKIDLDSRIVLSIGIRIKFEKKFFYLIRGKSIFNNQTREIYNRLSVSDKEKYSNVMVSTPEFIHLNSFAYEPLIDVRMDKLIDIYNGLKND